MEEWWCSCAVNKDAEDVDIVVFYYAGHGVGRVPKYLVFGDKYERGKVMPIFTGLKDINLPSEISYADLFTYFSSVRARIFKLIRTTGINFT
jgi:hypothetical protein